MGARCWSSGMMRTTIDAQPHPGQLEVHNSDARFKVLSAGRRWGKTRLGVNECLDAASKGGRAWWVSTSYKTSEVGWRPLRQIARKIPNAEVRLVDRMVTLPGGGFVAVRSADNPDSLRGEGLDFVVMDECAFMQKEAWTEAIRPALSDRQGKALFISTPKGRNHFWELYQKGINSEEGWQSWTFPTISNPFIQASEIEAAKRDLPEMIFRQEYLAEFLDDGSSVFRNINECIKKGGESANYYAGVDLGRVDDWTVLTIVDQDNNEVFCERWRHMEWSSIVSNIVKVLNVYKPLTLIESNGAQDAIFEQIRNGISFSKSRLEPFVTTSQTKQAIVESLIVGFEQLTLGIIGLDWQLNELQVFTYEYNVKTRNIKYSAPTGLHDDYVMSRAIANHAHKTMKKTGHYTIVQI